MEPESMSQALARLARAGFRHGLRARGGALRDTETGAVFAPEELEIAEIVRFEGESDPDEETVIFALATAGGEPLGTYAPVYGPLISREDAEVVPRLGG